MGRIFVIVTIVIFGLIGVAAFLKDRGPKTVPTAQIPIEISLNPIPVTKTPPSPQPQKTLFQPKTSLSTPNEDRIEELFTLRDSKLPFIKTIEYQARVPWQKGRPAWISDYARHFKTCSHFIARSLNGEANYTKANIRNGDLINIYDPDQKIRFHLLVDASRCQMWLYAIADDRRFLLKRYDVTLGRQDENKKSGLLTPLGTYSIGDRVAIYSPGATGFHKGEKTEMIRVFGTRWIPFEKAMSETTAAARGFGIHGVPWDHNPQTNNLTENTSSIGKYESDGCIRMTTNDIEELYAIIVRRNATIDLVTDFSQAKLPGHEAKK